MVRITLIIPASVLHSLYFWWHSKDTVYTQNTKLLKNHGKKTELLLHDGWVPIGISVELSCLLKKMLQVGYLKNILFNPPSPFLSSLYQYDLLPPRCSHRGLRVGCCMKIRALKISMISST